MTSPQDPLKLVGTTAYDQDGKKIGKVASIYFDHATTRPEWLTVRAGVCSRKEIFVPLACARLRDKGNADLGTDKFTITSAPAVNPGKGGIGKDDEARLYRHYGLDHGDRRSSSGPPDGGGPAGAGRAGTAGQTAANSYEDGLRQDPQGAHRAGNRHQ